MKEKEKKKRNRKEPPTLSFCLLRSIFEENGAASCAFLPLSFGICFRKPFFFGTLHSIALVERALHVSQSAQMTFFLEYLNSQFTLGCIKFFFKCLLDTIGLPNAIRFRVSIINIFAHNNIWRLAKKKRPNHSMPDIICARKLHAGQLAVEQI